MASYSIPSTLFIFNFLIFSISPSNAKFSEHLAEAITITRMLKTTHLHFFFQDIVSGKNPTAVKITGDDAAMGFGTTMMIDDALTELQDRDSKVIGKAQGLYSLASQNDVAFLMVVTFWFNAGEYNGSSVSMLGRNHVMDDEREIPIVGGSGVFRFARGYALAHSVWLDYKTGDATVEYNVYVEHY